VTFRIYSLTPQGRDAVARRVRLVYVTISFPHSLLSLILFLSLRLSPLCSCFLRCCRSFCSCRFGLHSILSLYSCSLWLRGAPGWRLLSLWGFLAGFVFLLFLTFQEFLVVSFQVRLQIEISESSDLKISNSSSYSPRITWYPTLSETHDNVP
jgi:hypothetical protein